MTFQSTIWLLVPAVLVPLLVLFYIITEQAAKKRMAKFVGASVLGKLASSYSPAKRNARATLMVLVILFGCLSLARPQMGHSYREEKRRGVDFVIALDVSKSMLAEDIKPNRLERSKLAILDLLERTKGDRVGLVAFAGSAFLQCPLTLDYDAFRQTLESITPEILSTQGTDIAGALLEAESSFAKDNNHKVVVMITDGEDLEAEGILQAKKAQEAGLTVYTVGVGSAEGELIPVDDGKGQRDWLRDPEGNVVRTKLDEDTLKQIAVASLGAYVPLGPTGEGLQFVYEQCLALVPDQERETHMQKVPVERYQWPLALAVLCWMVHSLLGTRRQKLPPAGNAALALLVFGSTIFPAPLDAIGYDKGKSLAKKGEFDQARSYFEKKLEENPNSPLLLYNLGICKLKMGDHAGADEAFSKALESEKEDTGFQSSIYEARAMNRFKLGESVQWRDPVKALELWKDSQFDFSSAKTLEAQQDGERAGSLGKNLSVVGQKARQYSYNQAVQSYREANYTGAMEGFQQALGLSSEEQRDEIHYNLGNSGYKAGEVLLGQNPQETVKFWENALQSYEDAIAARGKEPFPQAQKNKEILKKRLEELKKQQEQNGQEGDGEDQEEKDKQQKDQQGDKKEDSQDSKSGDQGQKEQQQEGKEGKEDGQEQKQSDQKEGKEGNESEQAKKGDQKEGEEPQQQQAMGRMTQEQAKQLLQQLRSFERKLPLGNLENIRKKELKDDRKGRSW
jgi:Ca-activated chloride channel family protein